MFLRRSKRSADTSLPQQPFWVRSQYARVDLDTLGELALDAAVDRNHQAHLDIAIQLLLRGDFDGGRHHLSNSVGWWCSDVSLDEAIQLVDWLWRHPRLQVPDPFWQAQAPHPMADVPVSRNVMQVALGEIVQLGDQDPDRVDKFRPYRDFLAAAWAEANTGPTGQRDERYVTGHMWKVKAVLDALDRGASAPSAT